VSKRKESKHGGRVECGVVSLYNHIERELNKRESCAPNQCHSAGLDGKEVRHDLWFLGVPFLDDTTLARGCSTRSWSNIRLTGVECMQWNEEEFFSTGGSCGLPSGGYLS
jgi:hypothetical protein